MTTVEPPTPGLALVRDLLRRYDLPMTLLPWAKQLLQQGLSDAEITQQLYDRPEFQARFPAIELRRQEGLAPISPENYIDYERSVQELFTRYGLPFPTSGNDFNERITQLLVGDVSTRELVEERLEIAYQRVERAPDEVRDAFEDFWGVRGDAALASLFLDPDYALPQLQTMTATARAAGTGRRFDVEVALDRAEAIGRLGLRDTDLASGFQQVADQAPLFDERISETEDLTAEEEGTGAAFGLDATSRRRLARRLRRREASVGGGTTAAVESQEGITGLGSAE